MKTILIILYLFLPVLDCQQKEVIELFKVNYNLLDSKKWNYEEFSAKLSESNENVVNSKSKIVEIPHYTEAFPQIRGDETMKWDYSEFYNKVESKTLCSYNGQLFDYHTVLKTNKRNGDDLVSDIKTLTSYVYVWNLSNANDVKTKNQKKIMKELYTDIQNILMDKNAGVDNSSSIKENIQKNNKNLKIIELSSWTNKVLSLRFDKKSNNYYIKLEGKLN